MLYSFAGFTSPAIAVDWPFLRMDENRHELQSCNMVLSRAINDTPQFRAGV